MSKSLEQKWVFTRPKGVTYTAMCIWVDNNIHKPDCDLDKAYMYIWLICNMLVCKKKYFGDRWQDYNDFSSYLANDVFFRLRSERLVAVKSVLNYVKSIMNFRKMQYCNEMFSEVIDTNKPQYDYFNNDLFNEVTKNKLELYNHVELEIRIRDILVDTPNIILANIAESYKSNKRVYENLYISCLLTIINRMTLPNHNERILGKKVKSNTSFNDVDYITNNTDRELIIWHLPKELNDVVSIIVNRTYSTLINEIKEAINDSKVDEDEYASILATGFFGDSTDDR